MSEIPDKVNPEEIRSVKVLTPRLQKLKADWENAEPQVYVDDTLLFTQSWKETEGLPLNIRWAKALEKRLLECPLLIRDDEIIVGSLTKFIRGNGTLCAMKPREILEMCHSGRFDRKTSDRRIHKYHARGPAGPDRGRGILDRKYPEGQHRKQSSGI